MVFGIGHYVGIFVLVIAVSSDIAAWVGHRFEMVQYIIGIAGYLIWFVRDFSFYLLQLFVIIVRVVCDVTKRRYRFGQQIKLIVRKLRYIPVGVIYFADISIDVVFVFGSYVQSFCIVIIYGDLP